MSPLLFCKKLTTLPAGSFTHRSTSSLYSWFHSSTIMYSAFLITSLFLATGLIRINAITNRYTNPITRLKSKSVKPIPLLYFNLLFGFDIDQLHLKDLAAHHSYQCSVQCSTHAYCHVCKCSLNTTSVGNIQTFKTAAQHHNKADNSANHAQCKQ